ncbi:Protein N-acetyltransferase, RimJ/RimL family [Nakamurella panacisegetis]|uniref:Protein N-acetyltransferase, RimJ/RimL family n=1 Tax=Nakamurella panacisegetis TaxID=1090615 RepID=A0A1H0HK81_9ACTN|nr:GNAT family protein [Nakamurella panacisegetis]SDO19598.1 Protein N-acetyltransferase, RimJ/RimL family [Nakamurella panacisegetis]
MALPLAVDAFGVAPVLRGPQVTLVPLGVRYLDDYLTMLADPEGNRLTGTTAAFDRRGITEWLTGRQEHHDRADWAIVDSDTDEFLGEVVLNQFDPAQASANFRISLAGPSAYGHGHGTAAARMALRHGFETVGLHRIHLEVFDFNARARRSYAKAGFREEGVLREAHHDDDGWHDVIVMALLSTDPRPAA